MNSLAPPPRAAILPRIAVIIPVFGHSVLVAEAVKSALEQHGAEAHVIVLVNDGCELAETHDVCAGFAALYPERIAYLRRPNGGLSAARNTGIRFALKTWPSVAAIYLLDADNRLAPAGLRRAYARLRASPGASWVYPSIDMFGLAGHYDYDGPYSPLAHTRDNICEAGSLIAREVFEAGIWFDEAMRAGYEDWDFWLQAAGRGLTGVNEPFMGFQYRRRAESMLAESSRVHAELIAYLKRKHEALFAPKGLARLEAAHAPRYAMFIADKGQVLFTTDPAGLGETVTLETMDLRFWRAQAAAHREHFPPFVVTTNSQFLQLLRRAGLLRWVFWALEQSLNGAPLAALRLSEQPGQGIEIRGTVGKVTSAALAACGMLMIPTRVLLAAIQGESPDWLASLGGTDPEPEAAVTEITLAEPGAMPAGVGGVFSLLSLASLLGQSAYAQAARAGWDWRRSELRPRQALFMFLRDALGANTACYPYPGKGHFNIGFLLPIAAFGGVEKVAYNVARELKAQGWLVHLFVLGAGKVELPPAFATLFDTVNLLPDPTAGQWSATRRYQGVNLPSWEHAQDSAAALGLLYWLDVVINCHSAAGYALMGPLRRLGITTLNHLHVMDLSPLQMPAGHPVVTLAYEHAFDRILCCSPRLARWMHGMGVPEEKLLVVRNGPGFAISEADAAAAMARRSRHSGRLRALYLGRLDRQKGLARLAEIVRQTQSKVDWRIIGRAILQDDGTALQALEGVIEPPVMSDRALLARLGWAHVLVLPSHWEGMPLVVIEAMLCGVVVLATDTGALRDVITDGVDGFLVANDANAAEAMSRVIQALEGDREWLQTVSRAAQAAGRQFAWRQTVAPLVGYLAARQGQA